MHPDPSEEGVHETWGYSILSLHVAGHLPRTAPRRLQKLPVGDVHEDKVLCTARAQVIIKAGTRQRQQAALPRDTEIAMVPSNAFYLQYRV